MPSVFIKCIAVIDSCITEKQCRVARKFITQALHQDHLDEDDWWNLVNRLTSKQLEIAERMGH